MMTMDVLNLFSFLPNVLQNNEALSAFANKSGYSGYIFTEGEISLGIILGNTGFVLKRNNRFDYYNIKGEFTFTSDKEELSVVIVDNFEMDATCPIINHLYNFLSVEYNHASEGKSRTEQVFIIEEYLRDLYKSKDIRLSIHDGADDQAITTIYKRILVAEMDPVLSWEERNIVFSKYKETLNKIVSTKVRAHKMSMIMMKIAISRKNLESFAQRFAARPTNNSKGLLYKYTIGKIIWFFTTVKNNLGYSVALAVYGPFTYYFITMPMNPHAMQAVGRVRSVYLDTKTEISEVINKTSSIVKNDTVTDKEVTVVPSKEKHLTNIIYPSEVTLGLNQTARVDIGEGVIEKHTPTLLNMLLSTDVDKVNDQSWFERMSSFKQMQIGYEENIEYASRMGRLEQLETQYNFPMQVESTWEELERYNNAIFKARQENPNLSAQMNQFLTNEVNRTQQIQLYLWDRMARFILDQPYVMLDQDKEQKRNDYYVGRSFVFMQEMTNILSWRYKNLKKPTGYDKIESLANFYNKARKDYGSVVKNLAANSDLFKQKDIYNTAEFRGYMKRQWEILYLQNAKAEEASNNGLNMYIWSTRNTIWILQSIYSAKRDELAIVVKRDTAKGLLSQSDLLARSKISMMYEVFLHNLTLEYVGIRQEIMKRLGKDIESTQRMSVIENLKEFLSERDKLDGVNIVDTKTAGNKI